MEIGLIVIQVTELQHARWSWLEIHREQQCSMVKTGAFWEMMFQLSGMLCAQHRRSAPTSEAEFHSKVLTLL